LTFAADITIIYTMIQVLYPPGCYGNYLAKCIYNYTTLSEDEFQRFEFDQSGSSHSFMYDQKAQKVIRRGHYSDFIDNKDVNPTDIIISLIPDNSCNLDYTNNQYTKMYQGDLDYFLTKNFADQLKSEFFEQWEITNFNVSTHRWMLREWFSLWLVDSWKETYNREIYLQLATLPVEVSDLLENFETVFFNLIDQLKLDLKVDPTMIVDTHKRFLQQQTLHHSQKKCNSWVNNICNSTSDVAIDIKTIFDEAYLQHLLRVNGYNIYCSNLNVFPNSSTEIKKIIYENSNNYN